MKRNKIQAQFFQTTILRLSAAAFLLTLLSPVSFASDDAEDLINKMSMAGRELNYDGIFVYRRGNQMDTMRLIHKAEKGDEFERLISLNGHAREVIRNKKGVTCIFPDNQEVMVEKARPRKYLSGQLPEPIEQIVPYYHFIVIAEDRVAGRQTWVVNVIPKDRYRYGYQLWIDKDSKLLLKSELKTLAGNTIEQIMYTHVNITESIADELLEPELNGTNFSRSEHNYDNTASGVDDSKWSVKWLPSGFSMSEHETQTVSSNQMPMDHMIYSDGLAMVSVFIEKLDSDPGLAPGLSHMGGVNAFATFSNGYQVTVVGEVPQATVQRMALSVARRTN